MKVATPKKTKPYTVMMELNVSEPFPSNEGRYPYLLKPLCCLMSRGRLRGLLI